MNISLNDVITKHNWLRNVSLPKSINSIISYSKNKLNNENKNLNYLKNTKCISTMIVFNLKFCNKTIFI